MADDKDVKLAFLLPVEDGWPPVAVEHLWMEATQDPDLYVVQSTPIFVKPMAYRDRIRVRRDAQGEIESFETVAASANSTIWSSSGNERDFERMSDCLARKGWPHEGLRAFHLFSIAFPQEAKLSEFDEMLENTSFDKPPVAVFPCLRYSET